MGKAKRLTRLALLTALAMVLGYLESLLPPLYPMVAGAKIGLANIITVFVLFRFGAGEATAVSLVRVVLGALLFGNASTLLYSLAGAGVSLAVMVLLHRSGVFSPFGVSTVGGVGHNLAQLLVAMLVTGTLSIGRTAAVLALFGIGAGAGVGLCGALMLKYIPNR